MFPASKRISFFSSMSSRLVSVAAPYLTLYLPAVTFKQLPFLVFGFGALVASVASIFVPESLGHPLPDTLEEAAQFGTKSFWSCWSRKRLEDEIACQRLRNLENKENWEFINITKPKFFYSPAVGFLYETEFEIWDGLGLFAFGQVVGYLKVSRSQN